MTSRCATSSCKLPEDWVNETAVNAKRDLSILLSAIVPLVAISVSLVSVFVSVSEWLSLAALGTVVIVLFTPLSVVGFMTSDHRTRRVTGPLSILSLLVFALLGIAYLAL
jgi:hypothetical protein